MDAKLDGIQQVIDAARQGHDAALIDAGELVGVKAPMLVLPDVGGKLAAVSLKGEIDKYRDRPERRAGTAKLEDLASFIAHANRFKDADSAMFVSGDPASPSFTCVLDYHERVNLGDDGKAPSALPRFGVHRGSYRPVFSAEWTAWTGASGSPMTQEAFANLVQGRARDVRDIEHSDERLGELALWFAKRFARGLLPEEFYASSAKMLELSEGLTATITDRVGDVQKRESGATKITFESDRSTDVEIPAAFVIEVPVFRGGDLWQLPVRLRYTVRSHGDSKRAEWRIEVFGAERTIADVVKDMGETVREATDLPVFVGSPE